MNPSRKQINALLAFLPELEAAPGTPFFSWADNTVDESGVTHLPYVDYADWVSAFFRLAGQDCWMDRTYRPDAARAMVQDDGQIDVADLEGIRTMLTYCVRGERFSEGHWIEMINEGRLVAVLRRLRKLR